MGDAIAHRGPGRRRPATSTARSASATAAWRSSTSTPAGASRWRPSDGRYVDHLQRRGLQLPRAARRARGGRATGSARTPTPRSCSTPTRSGAPACVERFNGMFAFAIWDRERARAVPRPRPLRHQAALLRRPRRARSCSAPRSRRCSSTPRSRARLSLPHLLEYFTFQNIFTDGTLFDGVRLLPPGHHADGRARTAAPRSRSATGTSTSASRATAARPTRSTQEELDRLFRQAVERQLVSRRAGRRVPQRRHGLRQHHRARRRRRCRT